MLAVNADDGDMEQCVEVDDGPDYNLKVARCSDEPETKRKKQFTWTKAQNANFEVFGKIITKNKEG